MNEIQDAKRDSDLKKADPCRANDSAENIETLWSAE